MNHARLDQIIDMKHALVRLGRAIEWRFLEGEFGAVYTDGPGSPPLPTRLMAGFAYSAVDAINAVLAAAGYNFRLLIRWQRILWLRILGALAPPFKL